MMSLVISPKEAQMHNDLRLQRPGYAGSQAVLDAVKASASSCTAGRYLQCLMRGKGDITSSIVFAKAQTRWADRDQVVRALESQVMFAAIDPMKTSDYTGANQPVSDSFLAALRESSIPLRLPLRRVPMLTRLFVNLAGVVVAEVAEGSAIPVLKGDWTAVTLTPRKFAGMVVQTMELFESESPNAARAITGDLAEAAGETENRAFINPDLSGSVLHGAASFSASGSAVANVDADLRRLLELVPGAYKIGAVFVMTTGTAAYLATLRGSGGAAAYPDITPQGGALLGLPVMVTAACQQIGSPPTRVIGLISPSEICWAEDQGVELVVSTSASLKMDDAASAGAGNLTSMFQANAVVTRAIRTCSWYPRSGSGAYFVAGY
jgi:hypothetical protein